VLANILIPKNAPPPDQVVIWFLARTHSTSNASDGDLPFSYDFVFLPRSGRALVYPAYKGTYERHLTLHGRNEDRDTMIQWSKDLSRTIDYGFLPWLGGLWPPGVTFGALYPVTALLPVLGVGCQ
jgi:hypothetical protein